MGSDRRARRRAPAEHTDDPKPEPEPEPERTRTPSTRRSRAAAAAVKEEDPAAQEEEVMDHGNGSYDVPFDPDPDRPRRPSAKRKRDPPPRTKAAVRESEPFLFYNRLLRDLVVDKMCEEFLKPVLEMWPEELVPGYREKIKRPMDLGTVKDNLRNDAYIVESEGGVFSFDQDACANDIRLIFENCMDYNDPESGIHDTARMLLKKVNSEIAARDTKLAREQENAQKKAKRDHERRRRKKAEEEAARAAAEARRTALALEQVRKDAEEAERKRLLEIKRREAEWKDRHEQEKKAAVALAVEEALSKQHHHKDRDRGASTRVVNTSSVSSDEHEAMTGEVTFVFVSTVGMEKKRGRKSGVVQALEQDHDELMKRRKAIVDTNVELEKLKQVDMTYEEKRKLCQDVAELDFMRMKGVADIIAKGMNRPDILNEVEVDLDIDHIDNAVLREIQYFLMSPTATTAKDALRQIESDIADIESKLVDIRYQKV